MLEKEFKNWTFTKGLYDSYSCIESPMTAGFPDVVGNIDSTTVLVEYKTVDRLTRKIKFQKQQIPWHYKWSAKGGHSYILIECEEQMYLCHGQDILKIKESDWHRHCWMFNFNSSGVVELRKHLTVDGLD